MDLFLLFIIVSTVLKHTQARESVYLIGTYKFLPYEKLTDQKLNDIQLEIANATELIIERFAIPTPEILIRYLNNNTSIKYFYLNDITFDLMPDIKGRKIDFPLIEEYKIFVRNVELEDENEKNFELLLAFLLVERHKDIYYWFTLQLGTKTYVEYRHLGGDDYDCELRYFPAFPSNEFGCKRYTISKQSIDLTTLPSNLQRLDLHDVHIYKTTIKGTRRNQLTYFHDILNYLPELFEVSIKYSSPPNSYIIFDLSYLQRNLDFLWLSHAKVVNTKKFEKEHTVYINVFKCELCKFEITNYSKLVISTPQIELKNNYYNSPNGLQQFISSIRNVKHLDVDEKHNLNLDYLNGIAHSLKGIKFANINYQQPKLSLIFSKVTSLTLNINVNQFVNRLPHNFPNLEKVETSDTNPDLLSIFSRNEKLRRIRICFPETKLKGANYTLHEPRDFYQIVYKRQDNSWATNEDIHYSSRGIPYIVKQYIEIYIWTIFLISSIGLIGNVLIIIVYTRQKLRSPTNYIILSLAIHDCFLLILTQISLAYFQIKLMMDEVPAFTYWSEKSEGSLKNLLINPRGFKVLWYKLEITESYLNSLFNLQSKWIYPLSKAAYFGSIYTTVLLTFERYTAICFPFRVKDYFNLKSVRVYLIIFGILSIILVLVKGFESFYSNELFIHTYRQCATQYSWERSTSSKNPLNYRIYRLLFQGIFWNAIMYFVPIPLVLGLNYKIWIGIQQSSALRARSHTNRDQDTFQITSMLVCVSLVFVVCNSISGVVVWYHVQKGADHLADIEIYSCLPRVANSSVNFVIYSLLGKKFREEFVETWNQFSQWIPNLARSVCCQVIGLRVRRQPTAIVVGGTANPEFVLQGL